MLLHCDLIHLSSFSRNDFFLIIAINSPVETIQEPVNEYHRREIAEEGTEEIIMERNVGYRQDEDDFIMEPNVVYGLSITDQLDQN